MQYADVTGKKIDPHYGDTRHYMTNGGYTKKSGVPTKYKVQIEGSKRWYRVYSYCVSNSATLFIKKKGDFLIVRDIGGNNV